MSQLMLLSVLAAVMVVLEPAPAPGGFAGGDIGPQRVLVQRCGEGDVGCWMEVAAEARARGQVDEAEGIYRRLLMEQPLLDEAYVALVQLREGMPLSRESEAYWVTRQQLGGRFREYETRRFIVLSNADAGWTRMQGEYLERAHHQFLRFARRMQLRPLPLKHKLVCVLFAHEREYRAFAAAHDGIEGAWIVGHYSPRYDRVVFFHHAEEGERRGVVPAACATTIHEAIHQLHFHTRIKSVHVQYPLWICEGLATAFETDRPNEAFGPEHEYEPRRERFEVLLREGKLLPLRELVSVVQLDGTRQDVVSGLYHQSYAFVVWASRYRAAQLRAYLNAMLLEEPGEVDGRRHVAIFEGAFGNVEAVERQWLAYEQRRVAGRGG